MSTDDAANNEVINFDFEWKIFIASARYYFYPDKYLKKLMYPEDLKLSFDWHWWSSQKVLSGEKYSQMQIKMMLMYLLDRIPRPYSAG